MMRNFAISMALALWAMAGTLFADAPHCRTRRPAPGALSARPAATGRASARGAVSVYASERAETQLDVVDILMVFDVSARQWLAANGKGTPFAFAQARVAVMNSVLGSSQLLPYFRFRLAGVVDLSMDLSTARIEMEDLLDLFVDGYGNVVAQGALAKVSDRRESVGADIVSILTARGGYGTVGVGYSLEDESGTGTFGLTPSQIVQFGDWAYNVCSIEAVVDDYTQLHEIGHNMGAGHPDVSCADWRVISLGPQLYRYSSGYYLWKGGDGFYTVMAYNFGGLTPGGVSNLSYRFEPLPCFSSPNLLWDGVPVGTANNDNRRTLIETCGYVAQYRASRLPVGSTGVTAEENARAEAEWSASAGDTGGSSSVALSGFQVEGAFNPDKGFNGVYPYIGGVYSNGNAVGVLQFKIGKANPRKGVSKVSGTVTLMNGKKHALKSVSVPVGQEPQQVADVPVKGLGAFSGWFGQNGFAGTLNGTPYGTLEVRTQGLDGYLFSGTPHFNLDVSEAALAAVSDGAPRMEFLPAGEPVTVTSAGAWSCRRAASISYKAVKDAETGGKTWVLSGLDNPQAPNLSGLRLTCKPKTATFKGSFNFYFDAGTAERPKLKKVRASVTGVVVGGEGRGIATVKNALECPVAVR